MIVKSVLDLIDPDTDVVLFDQTGATPTDNVDRCEVEMFVIDKDTNVCNIWFHREDFGMTNFERIASEPVRLAEYLARAIVDCNHCPIRSLCNSDELADLNWECNDVWEYWLDQPSKIRQ